MISSIKVFAYHDGRIIARSELAISAALGFLFIVLESPFSGAFAGLLLIGKVIEFPFTVIFSGIQIRALGNISSSMFIFTRPIVSSIFWCGAIALYSIFSTAEIKISIVAILFYTISLASSLALVLINVALRKTQRG